jgi:hypothetical protein
VENTDDGDELEVSVDSIQVVKQALSDDESRPRAESSSGLRNSSGEGTGIRMNPLHSHSTVVENTEDGDEWEVTMDSIQLAEQAMSDDDESRPRAESSSGQRNLSGEKEFRGDRDDDRQSAVVTLEDGIEGSNDPQSTSVSTGRAMRPQLKRVATLAKRPGTTSEATDLANYLIGPCIASEVFLKKSTKGKWQKRLFQLRGPYLIYYDNPKNAQKGIQKGSDDSAPPDASIDLRNMRSCVFFSEDGGKMVLTSGSDNTTEIKATTARDAAVVQLWVEKINEQLEEFGSEAVEG